MIGYMSVNIFLKWFLLSFLISWCPLYRPIPYPTIVKNHFLFLLAFKAYKIVVALSFIFTFSWLVTPTSLWYYYNLTFFRNHFQMVAFRSNIISAYPSFIPDNTRLSTSAHQDPKPFKEITLLWWVIFRVSFSQVRVLGVCVLAVRVLALSITWLPSKPFLLHHRPLLISNIDWSK